MSPRRRAPRVILAALALSLATSGAGATPPATASAPPAADDTPPGGWPRPPGPVETLDDFEAWRAEQARIAEASDWRLGDAPIELAPCGGGRALCLVSAWCRHPDASCEALRAGLNPVRSDVGPDGSRPGFGVCESAFGGETVVLRHRGSGRREDFCRFADSSVVSSESLWIW